MTLHTPKSLDLTLAPAGVPMPGFYRLAADLDNPQGTKKPSDLFMARKLKFVSGVGLGTARYIEVAAHTPDTDSRHSNRCDSIKLGMYTQRDIDPTQTPGKWVVNVTPVATLVRGLIVLTAAESLTVQEILSVYGADAHTALSLLLTHLSEVQGVPGACGQALLTQVLYNHETSQSGEEETM